MKEIKGKFIFKCTRCGLVYTIDGVKESDGKIHLRANSKIVINGFDVRTLHKCGRNSEGIAQLIGSDLYREEKE